MTSCLTHSVERACYWNMGSVNERGPGNELGAWRAEQISHLRNCTFTHELKQAGWPSVVLNNSHIVSYFHYVLHSCVIQSGSPISVRPSLYRTGARRSLELASSWLRTMWICCRRKNRRIALRSTLENRAAAQTRYVHMMADRCVDTGMLIQVSWYRCVHTGELIQSNLLLPPITYRSSSSSSLLPLLSSLNHTPLFTNHRPLFFYLEL